MGEGNNERNKNKKRNFHVEAKNGRRHTATFHQVNSGWKLCRATASISSGNNALVSNWPAQEKRLDRRRDQKVRSHCALNRACKRQYENSDERYAEKEIYKTRREMDNGNEIGIRDSILKFVASLLYLARCDALSFPSLLCFASFFWDEMKSSSLKRIIRIILSRRSLGYYIIFCLPVVISVNFNLSFSDASLNEV